MKKSIWLCALAATAAWATWASVGQSAPAPAAAPGTPPPQVGIGRFAQREVDPQAAERGKALYVNNGCSFCHGADIRGGDGGPSLQRSSIVLNDQHGENIASTLLNGVPGTLMPAFNLTDSEIQDLAEFLHSFAVSNGGGLRQPVASILVGDAAAGRAYFDKTCAGCHSITGDLKGVATKFADPVDLQQQWIAPKPTIPVTAVLTWPDGGTLTGTPTDLDEFRVVMKLPTGEERTINRRGDVPKVDLSDPRAAHSRLIRTYTDKEIHDVTAYLVTLK